MRDQDWVLAHQIAQQLTDGGTDVNELAKVSGYLSSRRNLPDFFRLLERKVQSSRQLRYSGRTAGYFRAIHQACQPLKRIDDPKRVAHILGWSVRLMRYYQGSPGQVSKYTRPKRQKRPRQ